MELKPGMTKTAQVADQMERRIASGEWDISQPIPGLQELADEYGVSFGTVRAAQQILVDKGLLAKPEQGIPTRVIARPAALDARDALAQLRATYRSLGEQMEHLAAVTDPDALNTSDRPPAPWQPPGTRLRPFQRRRRSAAQATATSMSRLRNPADNR